MFGQDHLKHLIYRTQAGWDNRISLLPRCRQPGDRPRRVAALAGRGYMVAGGLPEPRPDHLQAVARVELVMLDKVAAIAKETGKDWLVVRIGIDSGPVVAGVIGRRKFIYDLWGDTVNTASRMESHGLPGQIQVTDRVAAALGPGFVMRPRGTSDVKGKRGP